MGQLSELRYTSSVIGRNATMMLDKRVGPDEDNQDDPFIDGAAFAHEMYNHFANGVKVLVKINSPGGRVTDGWAIIDAIKTCLADTHVYGLAASIAGICGIVGNHRTCDDIATEMVHPPMGGSNEYKGLVKNNLTTLLTARTKMTADKIGEMMNGASMHWFDSSEMWANGMVDEEPIKTETKFKRPVSNDLKEVYAVYNSLTQTNDDMDLKEMLKGMWPGKTESESVVNMLQLKSENDALKVQNEVLKGENTTLKTKIEDASKAAKAMDVKNLVDGAIKAGKIAETSRGSWEVMATADYTSAKTALDAIVKTKNASASAIPVPKDANVTDETKTYNYLTKHNPSALAEILKNDPAEFERLLEESINAPKTEKK
jgi:ATP-dependent protease ClpP protease subunit